MAERTVYCKKLGREAPGLIEPPFSGPLGQQIFENTSLEAWTQWRDELMIRVINEYRLNLADSDHYEVLLNQMKAFLNLSESQG
jgi:Fe-S cluster biosynthesis and repair protein YggX